MNNTSSQGTYLEVVNGRVHNLKGIHIRLPHGKLIVVTGVSGSGKSSLVFDLLYAESYRRYMGILESSFVRNFVDVLEKPEVDKVHGLQAVIGIGQEVNASRTRRSTVGTSTDIYAFLRLLYARIAGAYSPVTGKKMVRQSEEEIERRTLTAFCGKRVSLLAPLVTGRKGNYKALLDRLYDNGYRHAVINGAWIDLTPGMRLDRYKRHDIWLVVEKDLRIDKRDEAEVKSAIHRALDCGKGSFYVECMGSFTFFSRFFVDVATGLSYREPVPSTFSFNSGHGACETCSGLGEVYKVDKERLMPDRKKNFWEGGIPLLGAYRYNKVFQHIEKVLNKYGYTLQTPLKDVPEEVLDTLLHSTHVTEGGNTINLVRLLLKKTHLRGSEEEAVQMQVCPACNGNRLKKESLCFKVHGKHIAEVCSMDLKTFHSWLKEVPKYLTHKEQKIGGYILSEMQKRVALLLDMGLYYLSLNRPLASLSGGEIRRIRVATQIGTQDSHLVGVMYVLDEPSIGLHPRDNGKLISALKQLRDLGNTVIVVEHDRDTMLVANYLVEVGPGAGEHGGEIVAQGPPEEFMASGCATARFLRKEEKISVPTKRRKGKGCILLRGCKGHNLKEVDLKIPLGTFVGVTGVSGSGKSSLIHGTLVPAIKGCLGESSFSPLPYKAIEGTEGIDKVIEVTQAPIGRTQRSNVATYSQVFDGIRHLFAQLPRARIRGWKARYFSFNMPGGRCEKCKGAGFVVVVMDFLPSVYVQCEQCEGRCYQRETLEVQYRGKSIADVLDMTVERSLLFFNNQPKILTRLQALYDVGLGYIRLGHTATKLSGGEAQRVKLASELVKKNTGKTLYVLDEPTTGLHFQDVERLCKILQKLVDRGSTVIAIEHNMDFVKGVDYVVDMGPDGGVDGGKIVAAGTPEYLAREKCSPTGVFLREALDN